MIVFIGQVTFIYIALYTIQIVSQQFNMVLIMHEDNNKESFDPVKVNSMMIQ